MDGRNLTELTDTVAGLLADHERAAKLGDAGRQWVREAWDWDDLADRLRHLLDG